MNFETYCNTIPTFAVYPDANQNTPAAMSYLILKLCGETGELYTASKSHNAIDIISELGDVLWYIGMLINTLNCDVKTIVDIANNTTHGPNPLTTNIFLLTCSIAEYYGKILRNDGSLTPKDFQWLTQKLGKLLYYVRMMCYQHVKYDSLGFEFVLNYNLGKLTGRKQEHTLKSRNKS